MNASKWGRWEWPSGLGRWHAIVNVTEGTANLACGRTRQAPKVTAGRPGDEKCCGTCRQLDDLRTSYQQHRDTAPVTATPVTVPATTDHEPLSRPLAPVGICTCGCIRSDEVTAYKAALAAYEAAEAEQRRAAFEAYLATREEAKA